MEKINCVLCDSSKKRLLFKSKDYRYHLTDKSFNVIKCQNCELVYVSPRPTQKEISRFYPRGYYSNVKVGFLMSIVNDLLSLPSIYSVKKYKNQGRLLDVGCGAGEFLLKVKKENFEVYGVDVSLSACRLARGKGLKNIYCGELEKQKFPGNYFDVVTLWHSLEHLHYPALALAEIHRIMKKDGILIIEVPNINSLPFRIFKRYWFHLDIPRHLYHWSRRTVRRMLNKTGFEVFRVDYSSLGFPLSLIHSFSYWLSACQIKPLLNLLILVVMAPLLLTITILSCFWPSRGETIKVYARKK